MINVVKTNYWLFIIFHGLIFISGGCQVQGDPCANIRLEEADLKKKDITELLLIIADDRSGSVVEGNSAPDRLTELEYRSLMNEFAKKGAVGSFVVRVVGNPAHTGVKPLKFEPPYDSLHIPEDAIMTDIGIINCKNFHINQKNAQVKENNKKKINDFMTDFIIPEVINYEPAGADKTDLHSAMRDIEMEINSNGKHCDKVLVAIISDGRDESTFSDLTLHCDNEPDVVLIGWEGTGDLGMKSKPTRLPGPNRLVDYIESLEF